MFLDLTKKNSFCKVTNRFSGILNIRFLFILQAIVAIALSTIQWTIVNAQNATSVPLSTSELTQASIQSWMGASLISVVLKFIEKFTKNNMNNTRFTKLAEVLRKTKDSIGFR